MGALIRILGPIVAQMGLLLLRERFVRKVAAVTLRTIAKKAGPCYFSEILLPAAEALDVPEAVTKSAA